MVKDFNKCAVTSKKCVPQRVTDGAYPLPSRDALVSSFDVADLEGRWYITAGLNKLFDTFPCQARLRLGGDARGRRMQRSNSLCTPPAQVHYFTSPEAGKLFIRVNWRVTRPNGASYA